MNDMSVADVLRGAIDVLEQRGWYQGDFTPDWTTDDGPVCMAGAIGVACGVPSYDAGSAFVTERVLTMMALHLGRRPATGDNYWVIDTVAGYNDDPARTYEDVVLALKHAAADAEANVVTDVDFGAAHHHLTRTEQAIRRVLAPLAGSLLDPPGPRDSIDLWYACNPDPAGLSSGEQVCYRLADAMRQGDRAEAAQQPLWRLDADVREMVAQAVNTWLDS